MNVAQMISDDVWWVISHKLDQTVADNVWSNIGDIQYRLRDNILDAVPISMADVRVCIMDNVNEQVK